MDAFASSDPELAELAKSLGESCSLPYLPPKSYAILFQAVSEQLKDNPFSLGETSRGARDRCPGLGIAIPRSAINSVLKLVLTTPHRFGAGNDTPEALASAMITAVTIASPDSPKSELERLFLGEL